MTISGEKRNAPKQQQKQKKHLIGKIVKQRKIIADRNKISKEYTAKNNIPSQGNVIRVTLS